MHGPLNVKFTATCSALGSHLQAGHKRVYIHKYIYIYLYIFIYLFITLL